MLNLFWLANIAKSLFFGRKVFCLNNRPHIHFKQLLQIIKKEIGYLGDPQIH